MSKSQYFEEVEFETTKSPGSPVRPEKIIKANPEKIEAAIKTIEAEMQKIKEGNSKYTHYAIDAGNFGSPVGNGLKRMKTDPNLENIRGFVQLVGQDLGGAAQTYFKKLLAATLEEVPNV